MANLIKLKRSAVAGKVPTTANIELGELALNTYDGKLYFKRSVSAVESIVALSEYGNTQVADYLPSYTGNLNATVITVDQLRPSAIYTDNYYYSDGTAVSFGGGGTGAKIQSSSSNVTVTSNYVNVAINSSNIASVSNTGLSVSGNVITTAIYTDNYYFANGTPFTSSSGTDLYLNSILKVFPGTANVDLGNLEVNTLDSFGMLQIENFDFMDPVGSVVNYDLGELV